VSLKLIKTIEPLTRNHDVVLITGDGRSCPSDIYRFLDWKVPHDVISIGRSINLYEGNINHWANVDGADSKWWSEHLPAKNGGRVPLRHTLGDIPWYDCIWDDGKPNGSVWQGSSSLFATLIAVYLEYRKIILAGCPLDEAGHWFSPENESGPTWEGGTYRAWLDFSNEDDAVRVKSLSGYTAKIVGEATKEWIGANI